MRFKIFYICLGIVFIILTLRLFYLQIIKGNDYRFQSERNTIRIIPQKAIRGKILDRNGVVLVQDRLSLNVAVIPQDLRNRTATFKELSETLGLDKEELELKFRKGISAPFAPVVIADDIDKQKALIIAERINKFSGLILESEPKRIYPYKDVASHVLGYLGMPQVIQGGFAGYGFTTANLIGITGIEKYLEQFLHGQDAGMQIEVDNRGRQINLLGQRLPKKGTDVKLTIDIRVQEVLEEVFGKEKGAGILIDPFTGEILAMVSSPSFDPNIFVQKGFYNLRLSYLSDKDAPLFNRALTGQYPPGSVFKIITALAGLSTKVIDTHTEFYCPGHKLIGRREFKCWSRHGKEDLKDGLIHSCNVYFYNLGIKVGAQNLSEYAKIFSLGESTGIDLPAEQSGFVPSPKWRKEFYNLGWYQGDTANLAIGQGGLLVTPLQVLRVISVIANCGYLVRPHLIKQVGAKEVIYKRPQRANIRSDYLIFLKQALRSVVEDYSGTAHILEMQDLEIAAKTGTAQAGAGRKHGWLAGFFPFNRPKVAFVLFLEDCAGSSDTNVLARKFFRRLRKERLLLFE